MSRIRGKFCGCGTESNKVKSKDTVRPIVRLLAMQKVSGLMSTISFSIVIISTGYFLVFSC
jgi:hypothetical protein